MSKRDFIFIYKGKLPSKANYKEIGYRRVNGILKPFIRNKKEVIIFQNEAIFQLHNQLLNYGYENFPLKGYLKLEIYFFLEKNFEKRDLDNLEKFLLDVFEKSKIIENDAQIVEKNTKKISFEKEGFLVKIKQKRKCMSKSLQNISNIFTNYNF